MHPLPTPETAERVDLSQVQAWLETHREELVGDVLELVQMETPSDGLHLLERAADFITVWLEKRIGAPGKVNRFDSDEFGPVIVLDYPGAATQTLVALAHFDTVFPEGTTQSWQVSAKDGHISGPGVFDMKAGLVQFVWALRALDTLGIARPTIRLVLNSDEEIGSPFSRPLLEEAATGVTAALVFEGSAAGGAIKTARKGVGLFTVEAVGLEAHAGLDPEAGASAVEEIAHAVTTLHAGADLTRGTSINVGRVQGGTRANVIAGKAHANIDVRVSQQDELQRVEELLGSLTARDDRAELRVSGGWNRPIMSRTEESLRLYRLARAVATRLGFNLDEASVGGASDGNFIAALGIPVLDGLGAVGNGAHARHENVSIEALFERASLAAGVMAAFAVS